MEDKGICSRQLLIALLKLSEKAANVARLIRHDPELLSVLVREKGEIDKNPRFVHDFKTFADVLIQAMVTTELEKNFVGLRECVFGEECLEFDALDGSSVTVTVHEEESATTTLLNTILGEASWVSGLASELHKVQDCPIEVPNSLPYLSEPMAVWIDPIDSTAEYIAGQWKEGAVNGRGLHCVTVILGVFNKDSGTPVIGVMNRPFAKQISSDPPRWEGECIYGFNYSGTCLFGPELLFQKTALLDKVLVVSSSDGKAIHEMLKKSSDDWSVEEVAGAGYKLWLVATRRANGYALSRPSAFPWDVCAGHAIISACGGAVKTFNKPYNELKYSSSHSAFAEGILATTNEDIFRELSTSFSV